MSVFCDIVLLVLFVFTVIMFTRNGFAGTIIRIGKTWISLFFSAVLNPWVSGRINEWFLYDPITRGINRTLTNLVENNPNHYNLSQLFESLPDKFVGFLEYYNISLAEFETEYGSATEATDTILWEISERFAAPCSKMVSSIIAYVICFVLALIFFAWLKAKIQQRRTRFFRYVDSIMGFVIGVAIGYCVVFGLSMVTFTVFQVIIAFDANSSVMSVYDHSYVFKFVTEFDVLGILKNIWNTIVSK